MVIAQLLQTYKDVSIHVSVCIKYVVCIPAYMSISPIVFLKLTTQGHLYLIHLLVEKPHAHSSSNSIIRLDFFFSGEVLADTFVSFHLETRFVYAKA